MEVEVRAVVNNIGELLGRVNDLGAKFIKESHIQDYYFGDIGLYEKLNHSFWIRVRKENNSVILAYKGPTEIDGVYEEYEQKVESLGGILKILNKSGFENPINVIKKRITYKYNNIKILIDEIEGRGEYIELEKISTDTNKSDLLRLLKELGIKDKDIFHKGFITLFLQDENSTFNKWVVN